MISIFLLPSLCLNGLRQCHGEYTLLEVRDDVRAIDRSWESERACERSVAALDGIIPATLASFGAAFSLLTAQGEDVVFELQRDVFLPMPGSSAEGTRPSFVSDTVTAVVHPPAPTGQE